MNGFKRMARKAARLLFSGGALAAILHPRLLSRWRGRSDIEFFEYLCSGLRADERLAREFGRRVGGIDWGRMEELRLSHQLAVGVAAVVGQFGPVGEKTPMFFDALVIGMDESIKRFGRDSSLVFLKTDAASRRMDTRFARDSSGNGPLLSEVFMSRLALFDGKSMDEPLAKAGSTESSGPRKASTPPSL